MCHEGPVADGAAALAVVAVAVAVVQATAPLTASSPAVPAVTTRMGQRRRAVARALLPDIFLSSVLLVR
jgi:hypothetical protein